MSPRAAWRLETLGFKHVFDYVAGKADWAASGLPVEGTSASEPSAAALSRTDVPTADLKERLQDAVARVRESNFDTAIVVNDQGVVLGRLGRQTLDRDDESSVEEAMSPGPRTYRPNHPASRLIDTLRKQGLSNALITRSDGTLIGLLIADDNSNQPAA